MPAKIRITDIERITLDVPFTPRTKPWNELLVGQWRVVEVIRISTDAGITGYGETLPYYTFGNVRDETIAQLRGANPAEYLGDDSVGASLQMALYDVVGKALGVPAYHLLPKVFQAPILRPVPELRVRDWVPIAWWNTKMPPEVLAEEAKAALAQGYIAHKFKARPWFDVYAQVEAISEVTPPHYKLDMDWNNMLLNAGNAAPVLTELDKYERVALYESPIMHHDFEGNRLLRHKTTHPIALHFGDPPFPTAVREEVCDGFVVHNGVAEILRKGTLAGAFEKPFFLQMVGTGLTTALMAHVGAVLPFAQWPAITCMNIWTDDLLVEPLMIRGGYLKVPEAPGLGVEVDESALERYRMQPPYRVEIPKTLLSVVWPGGRVMHFANMEQCWTDFWFGKQPVQERGVTFEVRPDDGSREWAELYARAERAPVRDQR
ncbi:MAG TPA: mandelate racemase/muconate lactonizing enzyme family protein [Herpetosiphonaceae bacterium]|nr:mandelate racemase/muconate lactonizing enzyme family protein [Herpetosiphonaceae bacterium]